MPVNSFDDYPMTWRPQIEKDNRTPYYITIAQTLEKNIREGLLKPNDKLPPQRELADFLDVNLSTIARAFKLCATKGLISGEIGRGTYIASDVLANLPMLDESGMEQCINMGASHPLYKQNEYVTQLLKKLVKKANISSVLEYAETSGRLAHRKSGQVWLARYGLSVPVDRILITSGLQNSIAIILASLFCFGDKIATNTLIYPGLKNIAGNLGIQLVPVPYSHGAMDVNTLNQLCRTEGIKGIYLIPNHHNPTAVTMAARERENLAKVIHMHSLICMEDGTYSFLCPNAPKPISALIPEQSIYISTISNALSAGLRIAFVVMPSAYLDRLKTGNNNINVMAAPLDAELVSQLIDSGLADQMINEKRAEMKQRNDLVDSYLSAYSVLGDNHAQFRWLKLPKNWTGLHFESVAREKGVQVFSAERFAVGSAAIASAVRLAISTPRTVEELEKGLKIIKELLTDSH